MSAAVRRADWTSPAIHSLRRVGEGVFHTLSGAGVVVGGSSCWPLLVIGQLLLQLLVLAPDSGGLARGRRPLWPLGVVVEPLPHSRTIKAHK